MDDLQPRIAQLTADLDQLEAAMEPLLLQDKNNAANNNFADAALRLPLLDKAKLHVLASYALESTLFCSLGLSGVDARNHAVYRELLRVRQYMAKIGDVEKAADGTDKGPTSRLDKAAAIRFVRAEMDSPEVKSQLDQLVKEARAASDAAATGSGGSGSEVSRTPSPGGSRRHHKRSSKNKGSHHHPYARGSGSRPA